MYYQYFTVRKVQLLFFLVMFVFFFASKSMILLKKGSIKLRNEFFRQYARKGVRHTQWNTEDHMNHVTSSLNKVKSRLLTDLKENGYAIANNVLGLELCKQYRSEAEKLYQEGHMVASQSTRWDNATNTVISYDKYNVMSTQLQGGEMYYIAPRLHEYVVTLVKSIAPAVLKAFPASKLSENLASNKLAVCLGNGSSYEMHIDNTGSDDLRKLTVLYYLNPEWSPSLGGQFRAFKSEQGQDDPEYEDITAIGDRLLIFWSDTLEHSVLPSFAPRGPIDYRYALTVWIATTDARAIRI